MRIAIAAVTLLLAGSALAGDPAETKRKSRDVFDRMGSDTDVSEDGFSADSKLALRFYDADTGAPIPGATVTFEGTTEQTDREGRVTFPHPRVPEDREVVLKAQFRRDGWSPADVPVRFLVGEVFLNRFSIAKSVPLGRIRIVLDWSATPADLDAHLVKTGRYHVSYRDMQRFEDQAALDRDDLDGEGPETVTVLKVDDQGSYTFYVHDYTNAANPGASQLKSSRARVSVFTDRGLAESFHVTGGAGVSWRVFEIVRGRIVPRGDMLATAPPS